MSNRWGAVAPSLSAVKKTGRATWAVKTRDVSALVVSSIRAEGAAIRQIDQKADIIRKGVALSGISYRSKLA
jgi:hypothetical protein